MSAYGGNYPLYVEQDTTWVSPVFTATNEVTGVPINLLGYGATMKVRTTRIGSGTGAGSVLLTLSSPAAGIVLGGSAGTVVISLTSTQTGGLNQGNYWYDLLLTDPTTQVTKFLSGPFIVNPTVTQ